MNKKGCADKEYWMKRGYSEEQAILKQRSYIKTYPEYWIKRGFNKEDAEKKAKSCCYKSKGSKRYWLTQGLSEKDATKEARKYKRDCPDYWIRVGMDKDSAIKKENVNCGIHQSISFWYNMNTTIKRKNNMSETQSKRELILGEKFEKALTQAADVKNNGISLCRTRNKNNYMSFYDLILASRPDVQELMNKKGKQKTQAVIDQIKAFRSETSKLYKQVCDYLIQEEATEDDETKLQKNIKKISSVVALMNYIGDETIEKEFAKYGIKLEFTKMEDKNETFAQDHIRETMKNVFDNGKTIKLDLESENTKIKDTIYHAEVPEDLQYDKDTNPTGIKSSDFCKLVDIHAKMLRAKDNEEETEKIKTRAEKIAGEYVFQNARNELVNNKMTEFTT